MKYAPYLIGAALGYFVFPMLISFVMGMFARGE
jgi:EamA domain-containing membrane protein RarD